MQNRMAEALFGDRSGYEKLQLLAVLGQERFARASSLD